MPSLNLGWVPRLLAWGIVLIALHVGLGNIGLIFSWGMGLLQFTLGTSLTGVIRQVLSLLIALKFFSIGVGFTNPMLAGRLDPFPKLLPWLWQSFLALLTIGGRALIRLVEGR